MDVSLFDYDLPKELIAQRPLDNRSDSRLMVLKNEDTEHTRFSDLLEYLREGDTLVLNRTKVIRARLWGRKPTGGKLEVMLVREVDENLWECLIGGKRPKAGMEVELDGGVTAVLAEHVKEGRWLVGFRCPGDISDHLPTIGEMPTPPYIKEKLGEPERYQTVYAKEAGSVAAPTAGLHFTPELLADIDKMGVRLAYLTLHVGPGTFMPVRSSTVEGHRMEAEYATLDRDNAELINTAKERGRLLPVGTTSVRALESIFAVHEKAEECGHWTDLFIYPGYEFRSGMDGMLTNFHLPGSTLIMMVSAFWGRERVLEAYAEAVRERYRFYSFGDAMLMVR